MALILELEMELLPSIIELEVCSIPYLLTILRQSTVCTDGPRPSQSTTSSGHLKSISHPKHGDDEVEYGKSRTGRNLTNV